VSLYLDTSALVKLYVDEPDTDGMVALSSAASLLVVSMAAAAELPAALSKAVRIGRLATDEAREALDRFWGDWPDFYAVAMGESVARSAGEVAWRLGLRGYDAIHLATALAARNLLHDPLVFACYDRALWEAARAEGLDVYPH